MGRSKESCRVQNNEKVHVSHVTSLLAILEQDHGASWQPGQECVAFGAAVLGEQRAGGGAPLPLALTRRLMLLGRMHAWDDEQAVDRRLVAGRAQRVAAR